MALPANHRLASALFVDFDNVYNHLRDEDPQSAGAFAVSPGAWIRWLENGLPGKLDNGQRRTVAARLSKGHIHLQETLCDDILTQVLAHPKVQAARVSTAKPDVYPDCDAVGVEVFRAKP